MHLSTKLDKIAPSGTVAFTALIRELRAAGRDVIDLAVGEPDFAVDAPVVEASCTALQAGRTRYGPVAGDPALRTRLAEAFEGYGPDNVIVTNGAKQGLFEIFQVICDEGREVIIPTPCWVSFTHQVRLAGGVPVSVPTRDHQLDLAAIEEAITDRTAAILINSPNNPTGAVYDRTALARIVDLCRQNDLWLISDEAYAFFNYGSEAFVSPFVFPAIRSRLMVVRSFSKTYAMTGFRIGYVAAPEEVIARLITLQGHLTGNVCTFAQEGALRALELPADILEKRRLAFQERRDLALSLCSGLFDPIEPEGAFYLFPGIAAYRDRFSDDRALARHLLEAANVAVVPGTFFGAPGHIRLSFAAGAERLAEGMARIRRVL